MLTRHDFNSGRSRAASTLCDPGHRIFRSQKDYSLSERRHKGKVKSCFKKVQYEHSTTIDDQSVFQIMILNPLI